jgi:hypothetical protein
MPILLPNPEFVISSLVLLVQCCQYAYLLRKGEIDIHELELRLSTPEQLRSLNYVIHGDETRTYAQIVLLIKGRDPKEVIDTFDFTISQLITGGVDLYFGEHTWPDLLRKRLRVLTPSSQKCPVH